ncbi:MAG TPA: TolC family outer membrane protein [Novimethylophilus sp.]|uniref:TolC family outer membrane protein n=1 Tax=Novimethylophilus sp. TaxID=2137426 RepID=UPI002F4248E7
MQRLALFSLAFFIGGNALADDSRQNLMDIYRQAQANDSAWAAARSANVAAQEKLIQGKALTLPTVTINANANHSNTDLQFRGSGGSSAFRFGGGGESFETYGYSVNVSHPLYRKQNSIQYEESKTQVAQADEQLNIARLDLMTRTSQAYFDVLLAQVRIDLIGAQKAAITQQLEQAKANFEVGTSTITDVHEAQARYDLLIAQEITARNDYEARRRTIQSIIGQVPHRLVAAKEQLPVKIPEPQDMEQWVEIAEQQSYQLKIQQFQLQLASQEIERAHAGHLPTLDAVGGYNDARANGSANGIGSDQKNFTIGLQFQVPLYQGGAIASREREAIASQQKAKDDLEQARRTTDLQTRQAYLDVASAVAQVKANEQALVSSQSSLDSTSLGYEVGVRTSVDVLNAQQQFYSAKRDLLQARYTWLLSVIKLKAAAGVLNENDLVATTAMLEGS